MSIMSSLTATPPRCPPRSSGLPTKPVSSVYPARCRDSRHSSTAPRFAERSLDSLETSANHYAMYIRRAMGFCAVACLHNTLSPMSTLVQGQPSFSYSGPDRCSPVGSTLQPKWRGAPGKVHIETKPSEPRQLRPPARSRRIGIPGPVAAVGELADAATSDWQRCAWPHAG
jgi:hypothetical protein